MHLFTAMHLQNCTAAIVSSDLSLTSKFYKEVLRFFTWIYFSWIYIVIMYPLYILQNYLINKINSESM